MDDIVLFNECSIDDIKTIGKKAAFISELHSKGFNVPAGFIMTGNLFVKFIELVKLKDGIAEILMSGMDKERKSMQIQQTILNIPFPEDLANFIYQNYLKLGDNNEPFVALKVSSTSDYIEDYFLLNIQGKERLINGIKSCWASVFSPENIDLKRFKPSLIIQRMINPIKSGYVFSRNPLTGNPNEIFIQVCSGLGNSITLSQTIPSAYVVNKESLSTSQKFMKEQKIQYSLSMERRRTEKIELQDPVQNILDDYIIKELAKLAMRAESRISDPLRISFAIDKNISLVSAKSINTKDFNTKYSREYFTNNPDNSQNQNDVNHDGNHAANQPHINEIGNEQQQEVKQDVLQNNYQNSANIGSTQNEIRNTARPVEIDNFIDQNENQNTHMDYENEAPNQHQNQNNNESSDDMLKYYEPEVHHSELESSSYNNSKDNQVLEQRNEQPNQESNQSNVEVPEQSQHHTQINQQDNVMNKFENRFTPENPKEILKKINYISSFSIVSCDMAINSALRKRYRDLFFKEPPINQETIINDMRDRVNIPYEEEIRRIRRLRDNFLNSGREPEPRDIHYALDYTKKFVDEF